MASSTTTTPPYVEPDMPNGCETGACALAKCFYDNNFQVLRRLRFRRELSDYYIRTFATWAPPEVVTNPALQRSFSQVLFALVHDGKILRVSNSKLSWAINRPARQGPRNQSHGRHPRGRNPRVQPSGRAPPRRHPHHLTSGRVCIDEHQLHELVERLDAAVTTPDQAYSPDNQNRNWASESE